MLTLQQFISETLRQVVEATNALGEGRERPIGAGTTRVQVHRSETGAGWDRNNLMFLGHNPDGSARYAIAVDFDIAVTAQETENAEAGGRIAVLSLFRADGGLRSETLNSSVSRVRFKIPVQIS